MIICVNEETDAYAVAEIRRTEQRAVAQGISEVTLMKRAAWAACQLFITGADKRLIVMCGPGNNGGDGYQIGCLAKQAGWMVTIYYVTDPKRLQGAAAESYLACQAAGVTMMAYHGQVLEAALIVDALLGMGLQAKPISDPLIEAIKAINQSAVPVLALDVPSGVNADTGQVLKPTVRADKTITFIGVKRGLLTGLAPDYCGTLYLADLGVASLRERSSCLSLSRARLKWPKRSLSAHKGQCGSVLVLGGDEGMPGAVRLAAESALRVGAGKVVVATRANHVGALWLCPECLVYALEDMEQLGPLVEACDVVVVGPGMNESHWSEALWRALEGQMPKPWVVDAGALRWLANYPRRNEQWILTPHPGEAAALLDHQFKIQDNRFAAIEQLQAIYGGTMVLKGYGTLIQSTDKECFICQAGNPGMASAGMGDVLTGTIAGLLAQGLSALSATQLAVYLHAKAADLLQAEHGPCGMLASDLLPIIRRLVNHVGFN